MAKISLIGDGHMARSLNLPLTRFGNELVEPEECDVCWIAIDTPVDKDGRGIVGPILDKIKEIKPRLKLATLVLVSSQIPVGTSEKIIKLLGEGFYYAYMPEHMRMGTGEADFMELKRIFIGVDDERAKEVLVTMFQNKPLVFTSVATGEMIKHALNSFLATSLSFIYDIADVCEAVGADVTDVADALRSDERIGVGAYLDASIGFSGGHLERDLDYLGKVAKSKRVNIPVINSVLKKNNERRKMVLKALGKVKNKKIVFLGITYKPGVPPSENSLPAKLMRDLEKKGAQIAPCDPCMDHVNPYDSADGASAIVCITPWEDLKRLDFKKIADRMEDQKILFDARNYFKEYEKAIVDAGIKYIGVGR